jgi:uncharacterized DUF497 family protein
MAAAAEFDFDTAEAWTDTRKELRRNAHHRYRFHRPSSACFGFTMRGQIMRVISLRRANRKESAAYHGKK